MKRTTLSISDETKDQLASFGKKGESFDIILQRVMKNTDTLCNKQSAEDEVVASENAMEEEE